MIESGFVSIIHIYTVLFLLHLRYNLTGFVCFHVFFLGGKAYVAFLALPYLTFIYSYWKINFKLNHGWLVNEYSYRAISSA